MFKSSLFLYRVVLFNFFSRVQFRIHRGTNINILKEKRDSFGLSQKIRVNCTKILLREYCQSIRTPLVNFII